MKEFNYYNKNLKQNANKLRKEMTKAEACLWKYVLRTRQMKGYTFNRQRFILNYIADFFCKELKLIIEVDGATHFEEEVYKKDIVRQRILEEHGYKIIRFMDEEILNEINNVAENIRGVVDDLEKEK
ncbi:MAG: DUF559 domain-containing protein [Ignavibacteria bacterium]|nr:DUF559 domain-containing protein [Ignavibacteria bacterium]